jgi:hypothetical protein
MTNPQLAPQPNSQPCPSETAANVSLSPHPIPPAEAQVNAILQKEIRLLRERGLSDECIHGLFTGFNIDATPEPTSHQWSIPLNSQLIGLIWSRATPMPLGLD